MTTCWNTCTRNGVQVYAHILAIETNKDYTCNHLYMYICLSEGATALHMASQIGHKAVVEMLLDKVHLWINQLW